MANDISVSFSDANDIVASFSDQSIEATMDGFAATTAAQSSYISSAEIGGNVANDKTAVQTALKEVRDWVNTPVQSLGAFSGTLLTLDGTGVYTDKTLAANTEITFAESGHVEGNAHLVLITTDGSYTLTFTKPIAYSLYLDSSLTNGGTLASGTYLFSFVFVGGSIKIGYTTMSSVAGDVTAPTLSTATVENAAPTQIVLTYDETLDATSTPATTDFTTSPVKTISTVVVSGTTVTITVSVAFAYSDTITLDYTAGANPIQDPSGNDAANLSGESVTNNITAPPTLTSATIESATDSVLDLVFDEAVTITTAGWNIDTDGAALSISSVLSGSGTTTPKFQLSRAVLSTETLNIDYNSVTGNTVSVASGVELETFTDTAVTNSVAITNTHSLVVDQTGEGVEITDNSYYFSDGAGTDQPFSILLWVKPTNVISEQALLWFKDSALQKYILDIQTTTKQLRFKLYTTGPNKIGRYGNTTIANNTWYYVAITYSGNKIEGGINIYINKSADTPYTGVSTGSYTGLPALSGSMIAQVPYNGATYFGAGKYNCIRVFDKELSSAEISANADANNVPIAVPSAQVANLVSEHRFNQNANAETGTNGSEVGTPTYDTDIPT